MTTCSPRPRKVLAASSALLLATGAVVLLAAFGAAPDEVRLARKDSKRALPAARFSHVEHGGLQCFTCHPSVFSPSPGDITHAAMKRGHFCGACHDGRRAEAVQRLGCKTCHAK